MSDQTLRIMKLGGSLLNRPEWPASLTRWLEVQPAMRNILLVGGGLAADAVRSFDKAHLLDPLASHRAAVEALGLSLHMAAVVLPQAHTITSLDALEGNFLSQSLELFDVRPFMQREEKRVDANRLPHDWSATSDSIAARVAQVYEANRLVLLKSALPVECNDWESAAGSGLVDSHFPQAVQGIPDACCVNLADPEFSEWRPLPVQQT